MKVLLLCAGYGSRLRKDLLASEDPEHKALLDTPKPLLPVSGSPIVTHWLRQLRRLEKAPSEVVAVVNDANYEAFKKWAAKMATEEKQEAKLVSDGTARNEDRLGAVACIQLALEKGLGFEEDLLVVAGDTLFPSSFSLQEFVGKFERLNDGEESKGVSLIVETGCAEEEVGKRGIIEVDRSSGLVTSFLEKSSPSSTSSRNQAPCFYLLHRRHLGEVGKFLQENQNKPLEARDATGNLLRHLVEKRRAECPISTFKVESRFDVGGLQSYLECCEKFLAHCQ